MSPQCHRLLEPLGCAAGWFHHQNHQWYNYCATPHTVTTSFDCVQWMVQLLRKEICTGSVLEIFLVVARERPTDYGFSNAWFGTTSPMGSIETSSIHSRPPTMWFKSFQTGEKAYKSYHFRTYDEVLMWLEHLDADFFYTGSETLVDRWSKCFYTYSW